jgi:antitoxin component of MazEF toxin-antitoxin module
MELLKKFIKVKRLYKISGLSRGLVIPEFWLRNLEWNDKLAIVLDIVNRQVVIREAKPEEIKKYGKKTSNIEPGIN